MDDLFWGIVIGVAGSLSLIALVMAAVEPENPPLPVYPPDSTEIRVLDTRTGWQCAVIRWGDDITTNCFLATELIP